MGDECQPAEVLILREQYSILRLRSSITSLSIERCRSSHTANTSWPSERRVRTTAKSQLSSGQKAHSLELALADRHDRFMSNGVRGVSQASLNIFHSQPRIGIHQVPGGCALCQFSKN
jgi:hypothetical protein